MRDMLLDGDEINSVFNQNVLKSIIEQSPNAFFLIDKRGQVKLCNKKATEYFGYSKEDFLNSSIDLLVPKRYGNHSTRRDSFHDNPSERKMGVGRELMGLRKNGTEFPIEVGLSPVKIEGEDFVIATILDITERKKLDKLFRKAIDVSWAYVEFDLNGILLDANDYYTNLLGHKDKSSLYGIHHKNFCDPEYVDSEEYLNFWKELKDGEAKSGEFKRIKKDGSEIWLNASYMPIISEDGRVLKIMKIASDITISKNYEKELEIRVDERTKEVTNALEELQSSQLQLIESEKMASLGQLIAGIAHEINTPMGAIKATVENLLDINDGIIKQTAWLIDYFKDKDSTQFFKFLEKTLQEKKPLNTREERLVRSTIRRNILTKSYPNSEQLIDRLGEMLFSFDLDEFDDFLYSKDNIKLLDNVNLFYSLVTGNSNIDFAVDKCRKMVYALKSFSRVDYTSDFAEIDVVENIETVLILYENQLKHGIKVIKKYDSNLPKVMAIGDALNQIWTNLIYNAIQAMKSVGVLTIEIHDKDRYLHVIIGDNGPGIPEEIRDKIFNVFFTTKPKGEGTGLGLDIVRKIVEKHAGEIYFESKEGETRFHVRIPKFRILED